MAFTSYSLLLFAFFYSIIAQDSNNSTVPRFCPHIIQIPFNPQSPVNSTGRVVIPWPEGSQYSNSNGEWSISMTFNDSRQRSDEFVRFTRPVPGYLQGYLSFPQDATGDACFYMLAPRNASSSGTNIGDSCQGILSSECIEAIKGVKGWLSGNTCRHFPDELNEACGITELPYYSPKSAKLSNRTCDLGSIPGNVFVPNNSRVIPALGRKANPLPGTEQGMTNFTYYDRIVRQPAPWIIVMSAPNTSPSIQVVCVTPNNVVAGSRLPQGPWPIPGTEQNLGTRRQAERHALVALFLAVAVFVFLL